MRALVVYESMFGNTEAVARAVAGGLSGSMEVEVYEVSRAPSPVTGPIDLLVVGGPTHAFSLVAPPPGSTLSGRGRHRARWRPACVTGSPSSTTARTGHSSPPSTPVWR